MALAIKNPSANAGDIREMSLIPGLRRSSEGGNGNKTTPVFLTGESHGQRSLASYSPWGCKESDTSDVAHIIGPWVRMKSKDQAKLDNFARKVRHGQRKRQSGV